MKEIQSVSALNHDRLNRYVDLDRYPIHDLSSQAGKRLIDHSHAMMTCDTLCMHPGFLREDAVQLLSDEINGLENGAHRIDYLSTLYGWMNNAGFPTEHPRSQLPRRNCGTITYDQLAPEGPCKELYGFDVLTEFIRQMLGYDTLYRTACPTLSIQVNVMDESESFGWHFDTNDGVVSFAIQNPDSGGGFEYAPLIRDEGNENYADVARILSGVDSPRRPDIAPGTLSLFLGRRSLHRVAPVGPTSQKRQSLLFSYDREPGMTFPDKTCQRITSNSPEPYLGSLTPVG
jgi:hypothetical protein